MIQLLLVLAVLCCSLATSMVTTFDYDQAMISLWLCGATYCGVGNYKSHVFQGPTTGFVVTAPISDIATDTEGYVGYLPSDKSIYVAFRGSSSIRDWLSNLDARKVPYTSFPECDCFVHKGFYEAEQKVIATIVKEVDALTKRFPHYQVKVTGHSLGAAMAQLTSMDLYKAGFKNVSVIDFGQPRTGDLKYATFATNTLAIPTWRVTHNRDNVPHLPTEKVMDFFHVCREEFEDVDGNLKTCDTSCEDPTCAMQYKLNELDGADHLIYLGMNITCESVSSSSSVSSSQHPLTHA